MGTYSTPTTTAPNCSPVTCYAPKSINKGPNIECPGGDQAACTEEICCTDYPTCDTFECPELNRGITKQCLGLKLSDCDAATCCDPFATCDYFKDCGSEINKGVNVKCTGD